MAENITHDVANAADASTAETTRGGHYFAPRVDIYETATELLLYADLPGVNPDEIDLHYERGELVLQGKVRPREHRGRPVFQEYEDGDYYRVFKIHETIDASKIEAEYKNGVLTVHLPKQESLKPKQVAIRTQ
jgi:HSP20 family protein